MFNYLRLQSPGKKGVIINDVNTAKNTKKKTIISGDVAFFGHAIHCFNQGNFMLIVTVNEIIVEMTSST